MTAPAYRVNGVAVSREEFYRNACDPARSVVVEACAGAGKTWMLVSRILRALLEGARPHEVLAITFTRKAAGEMQERLAQWLREFAAPAADAATRIEALMERGASQTLARRLEPELAQAQWRLLLGARGVQVQTFHAWFAQLLRCAPSELLAEIGLQRDAEIIESLDDHRAAVWRGFHAAVANDPEALRDFETLCRRRGRHRTRIWLETALERRVAVELADRAGVLESSVEPAFELWPELAPGVHPAEQIQRAGWQAALRALAAELAALGKRAQDAAKLLLRALEREDSVERLRSIRDALFAADGKPRKLGPARSLSAVQADLERLATQIAQHEAREEHLCMVRLSRVLLAEYAAYKRAQGIADMADLELCALAVLRDATLTGWVQERLDARYRHVLIDEFQDTSPLQWQALAAWLSGYAGAGGGASGQRAPSIFIVGDPKQSIYRFRQAEPKVFEAARRFVQDALDGLLLECDHTRRVAPQVLAPLNDVFAHAAALGEFGGFRRHTTEVADAPAGGVYALPPTPRRASEARVQGGAVWRDSLVQPRRRAEEVAREHEARSVARAVRNLIVDQGVGAQDIMVLCRKRQSLRLAGHALHEAGIAFVAVEDHELLDAVEARDLIALIDALVSPGNTLSLAQALRCPIFGASDEDLMDLARQAGAPADWWGALLGNKQPSAALCRARDLLQRWEIDARTLPPHDLLDRIVHQGEARERYAAAVPADRRRAALDAIDALLVQSLTLDGARYATPYGFVRALKRRKVRIAAAVRADAVQLLTVHGAKGLEARVVFVMDAQPEAEPSRGPQALVQWPVESQFPVRCAFVAAQAGGPPALREVLAEESAAREREELNALYVALSRAKERLVLSATEPHRRAAGESWWDRLHAHAVAWIPGDSRPDRANVPEEPIALLELPELEVASTTLPAAASTHTASTDDGADRQRSLGRAVHRFLEWATREGPTSSGASTQYLAEQAAAEFSAPADEVQRIGSAILDSPACARFFAGPALPWYGNEVPVSDCGELLRIDRLVRLDEAGSPVWWVLDYKLAHRREQLEVHRDQLLRYRAAVARAEPSAAVRCAFITGSGDFVEVDWQAERQSDAPA